MGESETIRDSFKLKVLSFKWNKHMLFNSYLVVIHSIFIVKEFLATNNYKNNLITTNNFFTLYDLRFTVLFRSSLMDDNWD